MPVPKYLFDTKFWLRIKTTIRFFKLGFLFIQKLSNSFLRYEVIGNQDLFDRFLQGKKKNSLGQALVFWKNHLIIR